MFQSRRTVLPAPATSGMPRFFNLPSRLASKDRNSLASEKSGTPYIIIICRWHRIIVGCTMLFEINRPSLKVTSRQGQGHTAYFNTGLNNPQHEKRSLKSTCCLLHRFNMTSTGGTGSSMVSNCNMKQNEEFGINSSQ